MIKTTVNALRMGHWPSLLGSWLHFQISCMIWLLVGALGVAIAEEFSLTATEKGFLVAVPLLSGALLRVVVGPSVDRFGAKKIGLAVLGFEMLALLFGWLYATTYVDMLVVGLLLGFAGASFTVALPIASQAYPPAHQGLAMGVAAVGNSGVVVATFFAPRLAQTVGWHNTFALMILPVLVTGMLFWLLIRRDLHTTVVESRPELPKSLRNTIREPVLYWLCFLYAVTFGGFVGLSSFFPIFFHDQHGLGIVQAGNMTALCALAGSLARPLGGQLADRMGGIWWLRIVFPILTLLCLLVSQLTDLTWSIILLVLLIICLGFGNGVVFQVVSLRFHGVMGTASGLIGAAGGIGGFFLPSWLGFLKDYTGTYTSGFLLFGLVALTASLSLFVVTRSSGQLVQRPLEDGSI